MPTMVATPVADSATDSATDSMTSLIRRRKPGYSLESAFYTSPDIFQADLDVIFRRHWIYVAVEPDVPEPGDCIVVDIDRASIIIARDDDMGLRAFHNVCRHRGARLVHDEKTMSATSSADITSGPTAWTARCCSPSTWGRASTPAATG